MDISVCALQTNTGGKRLKLKNNESYTTKKEAGHEPTESKAWKGYKSTATVCEGRKKYVKSTQCVWQVRTLVESGHIASDRIASQQRGAWCGVVRQGKTEEMARRETERVAKALGNLVSVIDRRFVPLRTLSDSHALRASGLQFPSSRFSLFICASSPGIHEGNYL